MTSLTITAAHAFGWDKIHLGLCCDCCTGYCPAQDHQGSPFGTTVRFTHDNREWFSDKYVGLDITLLTKIPADAVVLQRVDSTKLPTQATGPASGIVGPRTLTVLSQIPELELADSDRPGIHTLTLDGTMVGFATVGTEGQGLPVEHLPRAQRMANHLEAVGEAPLLAAAHAIVAWLATEETP